MHVNNLRAVSILVLFFLHYIEGSKTSTCEAPPVEAGKTGVISCKFDENVLRLKQFSLDFIPLNGSEGQLVTLASCIVTDTNPTCKNTPDIRVGEPVNTIINVTITYCNLKHTGRYMCTVMESEPGDNKPCEFIVKGFPASRDWDDTSSSNTPYSNDRTEKTDNTSTLDMLPTIIAGTAVSAVVFVLMVLVVLLLIKRNRSKLKEFFGVKPLLPTTSSDTPPPSTPVSSDTDGDSNESLIKA